MRKDRAKLEAYLAEWAGFEVDYNQFDCVRLVAGWARRNGASVTIDEYASKRAALRVLREARLAEFVTRELGEPIPPLQASWGDVVAISDPPMDCLGIVDGREGVFLSLLGGYRRVPLRACAFAWVL